MSSPWKDFPNNKTERPFEGIPAGQEPEVMPGFTAPAAGPWPPLSREQVVELHEALVDFRRTMESSKSLKGDDEQMALIWETATSLDGLLVRLHIDTPPQPRRWTNDDIQAALEKREEPTDFLSSSPLGVKHNCWTCGHNQGFSNYCELTTGRFERHDVEAWIARQQMSDRGADEPNMPPKDTTSCCPGWKAKP